MIQCIARGGVHGLLGLHGTLHDSMMRLQGLDVLFVIRKDFRLDTLAQAVLADRGDNLTTMIFLQKYKTTH